MLSAAQEQRPEHLIYSDRQAPFATRKRIVHPPVMLNIDELEVSPVQRVSGFLNAVTSWARTQTSIQALALVGSHARNAATDNSDVDLVILTDAPEAFLRDRSWAEVFGPIASHDVEDYGKLVSLRVHYEHGLEVEFGFAEPAWAAAPLDPGTREVVDGGITVLFDRCGVMRDFRAASL